MAKVIMNNVAYEANVGERLIDVARRNAVHMGMLHDGLGSFFAETTACRILSGGENLSAPSDFEQSWFQQSWLEAGHRLASDAIIERNGTIEVLSRAEELRRQTLAVFTPPQGTTTGENVGLLINNISRIVLNQVARFPSNIFSAVSEATSRGTPQSGVPTVQHVVTDVQQMVNDSNRVIQSMVGKEKKPTGPQRIEVLEE